MNEPLPAAAEPVAPCHVQAPRGKQGPPAVSRAEAERNVHGPTVTARVHSCVEVVQPPPIQSGAEHGFGHDEPAARHPQRLVHHSLGVVAVMKGEENQRGVEGDIGKR